MHAVDMPPVSIENYVLWLFVAGNRPQSLPARRNIEQICEFYFKGHCELTVLDVSHFKGAIENGVLLTPTLLLVSPPPRVTIIGSLDDAEKVVAALRLSEPKP